MLVASPLETFTESSLKFCGSHASLACCMIVDERNDRAYERRARLGDDDVSTDAAAVAAHADADDDDDGDDDERDGDDEVKKYICCRFES